MRNANVRNHLKKHPHLGLLASCFSFNFSGLKWETKLNLTSEFIMNPAFSFCPDFYSVDFSGWAGDFCFKLVTSSKILVAMATKMVATWRVG